MDIDGSWLVVGLGNPGPEYELTRHNLGFMLIDRLAADLDVQVKREECRSLIGRCVLAGKTVELAKPLTYMNLSGEAVSCLLRKPDRDVGRLIVISDDLALPLGAVRIKPKGSHGGQNGLRSIIDRLRTSDFIRLRIGMAPGHPVANTRDFVLQNFAKSERETVEKVISIGAEAINAIITDGVEFAMSRYNGPVE